MPHMVFALMTSDWLNYVFIICYVCACMYLCMCVCMCLCAHACMYMCVCVCLCACVPMHACICVSAVHVEKAQQLQLTERYDIWPLTCNWTDQTSSVEIQWTINQSAEWGQSKMKYLKLGFFIFSKKTAKWKKQQTESQKWCLHENKPWKEKHCKCFKGDTWKTWKMGWRAHMGSPECIDTILN